MEVKTFDISQLEEAKAALKEAFLREEYDENYNEWEFAQRVLQSPGYVPSLCLTAWQDGRLVGYNILTEAAIGESQGLALGPLGVRPAYQSQGAGSLLVEESLRRAKAAGYPWVAVLGGSYYARFGFEPCAPYGITVSEDAFANEHLQILFFQEEAKAQAAGRITYCDAFTMEMEISCKVIHETTQRRFAGKEGFTL